MKLIGKGTIYKNEYGYSISDNQKNQDGTYTNFYIPVKFQKGLEAPAEKSFISFEGFTKPYKTKEGKTNVSYFIMDYTVISKAENQDLKPKEEKSSSEIYFDDIKVDDSDFNLDLPF